MTTHIRTITRRAVAALVAGGALGAAIVVPAGSASATNVGTQKGNHTVGCSVDWKAASFYDRDAADMPADLMVNLKGEPVDPSNGGYVTEVSPAFGDPGNVEIQHYFTPDGALNWRVFVGTDHAISGAVLHMTLPDVQAPYTVSDMTAWGAGRYAPAIGAAWTTPANPTDLGATTGVTGTHDVVIGDMPANSSATILFRAMPAAAVAHDGFTASATINGAYTEGAGCEAPVVTPVEPVVTPTPVEPVVTPAPVVPVVHVTPQPTTTVTPEPVVTQPATPVLTKPAVPVVTKPAKPVVTKPARAMVTRTFQVDRYMPKTAGQARVVARLDDDRRLGFREDKALWGASVHQFVSVRVPVDASVAQVMKAVNAKTSAKVGDVRTVSALGSARVKGGYTVAWELGRGASVTQAWGAKKNVAQTFLARS